MRIYLSPLGFDPSPIISLVVRSGIERGDRICLIRPETGEDLRADRAIETIRETTQRFSDGINIDVLRVNNRSIESMTLTFLDEICASTPPYLPDSSLTVNLSGGPREVLVALTIATLILAPRIHQCATFSDIERDIEIYELPRLPFSITERKFQVLSDIATHGPSSISEISSRINVSESTGSRVCAKLASRELVKIRQEDRSKIVTLQFGGKIMLKTRDLPLESEMPPQITEEE